MTLIYGADTDKPLTTLIVRDAIIECFSKAHIKDVEKYGIQDPVTAQNYCKEKVREAFLKNGGDFNDPTKDSLLNAVANLAAFSAIFRDSSVIEEHKNEIMQLINNIPEDSA
jgi:hypothetical protein